jgi:hypothetical protein
MLLSLPRELRDLIIEEVLLDPDLTISEPYPHTKLVTEFVYAGHPLRITPLHNALLCTNPQLRAETLQRAQALGSAIPAALDILLLPSGKIRWKWVSRSPSPVSRWGKIEMMKVQVRVQPVQRKYNFQGRISTQSFATAILDPLFAGLQEMLLHILYAGAEGRVNSIRRLEVHVLHANHDYETSVQRHSSWFVPSDNLSNVERPLCVNMRGFGYDHCRDPDGTRIESIGLFCGEDRREVCMYSERLRVVDMVDRRRAVAVVAMERREMGW